MGTHRWNFGLDLGLGDGAAAACLLAALALTLVLAAWLTPRRWWRRPNLRALAVLGGGTLGFGALFAMLFAMFAMPSAPPLVPVAGVPATTLAAIAPAPRGGASYRVVDQLNLRSERSVRAPRVAVLPSGTLVTATGAVDGDWWQVRVDAAGHTREGWASSLWLRRADEGRGGAQ